MRDERESGSRLIQMGFPAHQQPEAGQLPESQSDAELSLLLACSKTYRPKNEELAIRAMLSNGIDWTRFVRTAVNHGLSSLAGSSLLRVAADLLPTEIHDAFEANIRETRRKNRVLFHALAEIIDRLAKSGVEAIPFKGPVLALQAYGDLGLRAFRDLDFLIRDADLAATIAVLDEMGYRRKEGLSAAQFDLIHRLQGQEIIINERAGITVEPHTRLTSSRMAIDVDYEGLRRRAVPKVFDDHTMLAFSPEDDLVVLAIHGSKEVWWDIKWACDVVAFIESHPTLDWTTVIERAKAQGCFGMLVVASALAHRFFQSAIPETLVAAARADAHLDPMINRIVASWRADEPTGPAFNTELSSDRLRLHDGITRQARYVARTLFLPGPQHVASTRLPKGLTFFYGPMRLANDFVALPLWRVGKEIGASAQSVLGAFVGSELSLGLMPVSAQTKSILRKHRVARANAVQAVRENPDDAEAWRNLGDAHFGLRQHKKAIACYDKALAIVPTNTTIWKSRTAAMAAMGQTELALARPPEAGDARSWTIYGSRLFSSARFAEASDAADRAIALDPSNAAAARIGVQARLLACDWSRRKEDEGQIAEKLATGARLATPFYHRAISDSETEHLALASLWVRRFSRRHEELWQGQRYRHEKIRIAYMSTDFRNHVVADMIVGCIEHHDHDCFETTAVSLGVDDGSNMRRRIASAVDRFVDGRTMSDEEVARTLRELEIDIVIDLNGNSGEARPDILAHRPAPLQVSYLGYPGTTGQPFVDYLIADPVVIPKQNQSRYTEKIVYLPYSYMPNDDQREISISPSRRSAVGLPETGIVFACHNHEYKIGPETFDVWMRLLREVEGSVLWLKSLNPSAISNLLREAKARGVDPGRLIFARHVSENRDHLARLGLADLFLDTLPYNAHATACDALWAGLPVLTCIGNSFQGRVAASLLYAVGLPELVTNSLAEYTELALTLARDPARLESIKAKLRRNRSNAPLFDTSRHTRHLEAAYTALWERHQANLPPQGFSVPEQDNLSIPAI